MSERGIRVVSLFKKLKSFFTIPSVPKLDETWWGPANTNTEDETIRPFKVNVPDEVLKDLRHRLEIALPFQKPLENARQHYGMNTNLLKSIVEYWKNDYDWRKQETKMNLFPQFQVSVQGLKIHFLHVKPKQTEGVKVLPLLLLHGWPGSVREFHDILPLLTTKQDGRDFIFEVIVPSLPGYGFSDGTDRKGLASTQIAVILKNLMEKLGFEKYYIQGGDWGSVIISNMAILYPDRILGLHTNLAFCRTPLANLKIMMSSYFPKMFLNTSENVDDFSMKRYYKFWEVENGYSKLQTTKPDTIGVALRDSPVGLAAYILEKMSTATNRDWRDLDDGGLKKKFKYSDLLDNIMIYWVTRCMTTSMRLYKEEVSKEHVALGMHKIPIRKVPCGCSRFYQDIACYPESIIREKYQNLVHITFHRDGGHFAAFEVPHLLATDIYDFVQKVEKC